jgi:hypothetical protein
MTCLETLLTREQATIRRVVAGLRADHRQAHPAPPAIRYWPLNGNRASGGLVAMHDTCRSSSGIRARLGASGDCAGNRVASADSSDLSASAGQFVSPCSSPSRGRVIEPYLEYLQQRWEQGEHNGRLLFEEIRAASATQQDLQRSLSPFSDFSTHGPTASLARAQEVQQYPSYSPKQTDASCFSKENERPGSSGLCRAC